MDKDPENTGVDEDTDEESQDNYDTIDLDIGKDDQQYDQEDQK